ncbi:uncharacterized protein JCM15063_004860 [Sporobolomyces koalae]|uniref:uncharacterized protein n=1 Tax=Sporobolomyces koalae TaxID=500713 RepID=UPI00317FB049
MPFGSTSTTTPFSSSNSPLNPAAAYPLPPSPVKQPATGGYVSHYTRPVKSQAHEPTMTQLLASQPTSIAHYASRRNPDGDTTMNNATGLLSWRKGQGFKEWEKQKLNSNEVKRKADVAQLFFYDHYFDLLTYIHNRKQRLETFHASLTERSHAGTLSRDQAMTEWNSHLGRERVALRKRRTKLKLDQFHIVTQVGQGGYGEVYLARHKETNQVVALKKMKKKTLAKMDEIRHVLTERDILASTSSPWLVRLLYAFQDPLHVYLAMDFIAGGDFRTLLNNSGVLKEEHARFYISEMFCSVNELHKLGYIHRDLKPENFLIDPSGHIKLTDFGLAAGALNPGKIEHLKHKLDEVADSPLVFRSTIEMKSIYKTLRLAEHRTADSVVGSPDYMAIETLRGFEYSYSVDYWSLGCILFEFLAGFPPFSGATPEETWTNLKNWSRSLRRPHYDRPEDRIFNLSDQGWYAITSLITSRDKRISTLDGIKHHPFFQGVDWDHLRDRKAPFVPALDSEIDAGYFDDFNSEADMAKYAEVREKQRHVDAVLEKGDKFNRGVWVGFTFKAKKEADKAIRDKQDKEERERQEEELRGLRGEQEAIDEEGESLYELF